MIQGLNNTITVRRQTELVKDAVGGARVNEGLVYSNIKCRISNPNRGDIGRVERGQGIEVTRLIKIVAWPSTSYVIEPGDMVLPGSGRYSSDRFIILDVKQDSLPLSDGRTHLELICERQDEQRTYI